MSQIDNEPQVRAIFARPSAAGLCTVRTVHCVRAVDTVSLRDKWGEYMAVAADDDEAFAILNRGVPEAVLMSAKTWTFGTTKVPVAEEDRGAPVTVRAVRAKLRTFRDAARRGSHTPIQRYSTLTREGAPADIEVVIAPYEWTRRALPELGEVVTDTSTQTRYRGTRETGATDAS